MSKRLHLCQMKYRFSSIYLPFLLIQISSIQHSPVLQMSREMLGDSLNATEVFIAFGSVFVPLYYLLWLRGHQRAISADSVRGETCLEHRNYDSTCFTGRHLVRTQILAIIIIMVGKKNNLPRITQWYMT